MYSSRIILLDILTRYGPGRQSRQQSLHKLGQLQQSITGWEGKDIVANCSEIVFEGKLKVSKTFETFYYRFVHDIFVQVAALHPVIISVVRIVN